MGPLSDVLVWTVVLLFALAGAVEWYGRRNDADLMAPARTIATAAWVGFGLFWLNSVPFWFFEHQSYVEAILAAVAVPGCLYAARELYTGRTSLFILSRAIAVMGFIYLPFETIPAITVGGLALPAPRQYLIEITTAITGWLISLAGYSPELIENGAGYPSTYQWVLEDGHIYNVSIVLACTGLGSIAVFGGLIAAVRAPLSRKLRGLAVAVPIIFTLNVMRTAFISIVSGNQLMHWFPNAILFMFGETNPYRVSFLISDRIISQVGAVIALMAITYLVVRELPELLTVLEDVLYLLTGEEHDLQEALDLPREPAVEQPEAAARSD
ncbi:archaeosortase A [Halonotius terrestris]|uniref:Archaeosortase A n=1 Tax=Halonotius terrestris TaxID=2487750 RepID=A0A8J8PD70_9EURY|nr:archaeosortase A [Halonotius terrestris]TQQ83113.1 archaeosortase A [Halonotius terrestris]